MATNLLLKMCKMWVLINDNTPLITSYAWNNHLHVSLHTQCVRLSARQEQARLREFCVKKFLECSPPPPPRNENCQRGWDFGFELVQSTPPPPPRWERVCGDETLYLPMGIVLLQLALHLSNHTSSNLALWKGSHTDIQFPHMGS